MLIPLRPAPIKPLLDSLDWWMVMAYTLPHQRIAKSEDGEYLYVALYAFPLAHSHLMMRN